MLELHEKVWQWSNERIWKFKWLVIKVKKPNHVDGTFLIRGKAAGHTIEKIYPLSFGKFEKVLLVDSFRTRRARLYYIRDKVGKDAKMKSEATAEEKGVDLVALAVAEAAANTPAPEAPVEEVKAEEAVTETPVEEVKEEEAVTEAPVEEGKAEEAVTEAPVEEVKEEAPVAQADDLTKIEWVGPKIAELLVNAWISTYAALGNTDAAAIKTILEEGGSSFASHNPETRPKQSAMAAEGKWDELKTRQDELDGWKVAE